MTRRAHNSPFAGRAADDVASSATHGIGLGLSLGGLAVLANLAYRSKDALYTAALLIYGCTLVILYAASMLHHASLQPDTRRRLMLLDHCCVYLVISGTYTPFMLFTLRGPLGLILLGTVWALGVVGILYKTLSPRPSQALSLAFYLVMGWLILVAIVPFVHRVDASGLWWVLAGGLAYSVGTIFFAGHRLPYTHTIWHIFVLAGSALQYVGVIRSIHPS